MYLYTYFTIILSSVVWEDIPFFYNTIMCHDENLLNKNNGERMGPRSRVTTSDLSYLIPLSAA